MKKQFTQTVPATTAEAMRMARSSLPVNRVAARPYSVALATSITSSSLRKVFQVSTGPKTSFWKIS